MNILITESQFKRLIENIIDENINPKYLTVDYFKERIPFLKEYKIIHSPDINPHQTIKDRIEMRLESYNKNIDSYVGDTIYTFPQFNIISEFMYYSYKIRDNIFYIFLIKNRFYIIKPEKMDDLLYRVFLEEGKIKEERDFSKTYEIILKEREGVFAPIKTKEDLVQYRAIVATGRL